MHILVIEDDPRLADLLAQLLAGDHHVVDVATNGRDGLDLAASGVDAMVPAIRADDKEVRGPPPRRHVRDACRRRPGAQPPIRRRR